MFSFMSSKGDQDAAEPCLLPLYDFEGTTIKTVTTTKTNL